MKSVNELKAAIAAFNEANGLGSGNRGGFATTTRPSQLRGEREEAIQVAILRTATGGRPGDEEYTQLCTSLAKDLAGKGFQASFRLQNVRGGQNVSFPHVRVISIAKASEESQVQAVEALLKGLTEAPTVTWTQVREELAGCTTIAEVMAMVDLNIRIAERMALAMTEKVKALQALQTQPSLSRSSVPQQAESSGPSDDEIPF